MGERYTEGGYQVAYTEKITGIATTGTKLQFELERPFNNWLLQIYGADGTLTSWTVNLKGGLDADKVGTILTHSNSTDSDGDLKAIEGMPAKYVEVDVAALVLNTATSITVVIMAMKTG